MKLSDIKGERVFDVIAEVTDPLYRIASDEAVMGAFRGAAKASDDDGKTDYAKALRGIVPVLLKTHRDDLVAILSAVNGVAAEEYLEGLTMPKLFGDVYDVLTDEELLGFLA